MSATEDLKPEEQARLAQLERDVSFVLVLASKGGQIGGKRGRRGVSEGECYAHLACDQERWSIVRYALLQSKLIECSGHFVTLTDKGASVAAKLCALIDKVPVEGGVLVVPVAEQAKGLLAKLVRQGGIGELDKFATDVIEHAKAHGWIKVMADGVSITITKLGRGAL